MTCRRQSVRITVSTLARDREKPDTFPITRIRNLGSVNFEMTPYDYPDSPRTLLKYFGSGRSELKAFSGRGELFSLLIYDLGGFDARRGSLLRLLYSQKS
jgi:hypothetical protein